MKALKQTLAAFYTLAALASAANVVANVPALRVVARGSPVGVWPAVAHRGRTASEICYRGDMGLFAGLRLGAGR